MVVVGGRAGFLLRVVLALDGIPGERAGSSQDSPSVRGNRSRGYLLSFITKYVSKNAQQADVRGFVFDCLPNPYYYLAKSLQASRILMLQSP